MFYTINSHVVVILNITQLLIKLKLSACLFDAVIPENALRLGIEVVGNVKPLQIIDGRHDKWCVVYMHVTYMFVCLFICLFVCMFDWLIGRLVGWLAC
jgi:hypothetical protein